MFIDKYFKKGNGHKFYVYTDITINECILKCAEYYMTEPTISNTDLLRTAVWNQNIRNMMAVHKVVSGSRNIITVGPSSFSDKAKLTKKVETDIRRNKTVDYWKRGIASRKAAELYLKETGYSISHMTVKRDYEFFESHPE